MLRTRFTVAVFNFKEQLRVIWRYYRNRRFLLADLTLFFCYLFRNPYKICRRFLLKKGEHDPYVYGETPLTTLEEVAKRASLSSSDTLLELGCGRGRGCFWLSAFIGCQVVGIEEIPLFVQIADDAAAKCRFQKLSFRQENFLESDFTGATVLYFYGTSAADAVIYKLIEKLEGLPSGTRIITVSYPLADYCSRPLFELICHFPGHFPWGEGEIFLQRRR